MRHFYYYLLICTSLLLKICRLLIRFRYLTLFKNCYFFLIFYQQKIESLQSCKATQTQRKFSSCKAAKLRYDPNKRVPFFDQIKNRFCFLYEVDLLVRRTRFDNGKLVHKMKYKYYYYHYALFRKFSIFIFFTENMKVLQLQGNSNSVNVFKVARQQKLWMDCHL